MVERMETASQMLRSVREWAEKKERQTTEREQQYLMQFSRWRRS